MSQNSNPLYKDEEIEFIVNLLWQIPGGWAQPAAEMLMALHSFNKSIPTGPVPANAVTKGSSESLEDASGWDIDLTGLPETAVEFMTSESAISLPGVWVHNDDLNEEKED
jgi:hypothetical protein